MSLIPCLFTNGAHGQPSIPEPAIFYRRLDPVSSPIDESQSKSNVTRNQALGNMKIHPKPYHNEVHVSPTQPILSDQSQYNDSSPRQNHHSHFESRSSRSSISNRSSLTQASDLGIEMSRAIIAEKPILDHILAVDFFAPGK
jgi:hypothetical protein